MIEITGSKSEIVYEALPTDDPQVRQPDITMAQELLGWEPEVELREGLRRTIDNPAPRRSSGPRADRTRRASPGNSGITFCVTSGSGYRYDQAGGPRLLPCIVTIDHKQAIQTRSTGRHADRHPPAPVVLPERDVRRKRPPFFSFLLRARRCGASPAWCSLLALDFIGVTAAIFTALGLKLALRGNFSVEATWANTRPALAFAYLLTVLMFARADLYADRPRRPGLPKIVAALFQATVLGLVFALANGDHFSSYFIFYGSLFFGTHLHLRRCARSTRASPAGRSSRPATGGGRCSWAPGATSRLSRTPSADARAPTSIWSATSR